MNATLARPTPMKVVQFHQYLEYLTKWHPRLWTPDWDRIPRSIDLSPQDQPACLYTKTNRVDTPVCIQVYKEGTRDGKALLSARNWREGLWETYEYNRHDQLIEYESSKGAKIKQYWLNSHDEFPHEIHTHNHRWVRVFTANGQRLYWCAFTGKFWDTHRIFKYNGLYAALDAVAWGDFENIKLARERARTMPTGALGRWLWRMCNTISKFVS